MGDKDLAEMTLEGHPDVFVDMINNLALGGRRIIKPEDLSDATPSSVYKIDGKTHGQTRDVAKFWNHGVLRIASIGLENQTDIDATIDDCESDFGTIARLLSNQRKGIIDGAGLTKPLIHVKETLGLITALVGNSDLERSYTEEGKRSTSLAEYLKGFETRAAVRGREEGIAIGEARGRDQGIAIGESRGIIRSGRKYGATDAQIMADLVEQLNMSAGDAERAMREFGA